MPLSEKLPIAKPRIVDPLELTPMTNPSAAAPAPAPSSSISGPLEFVSPWFVVCVVASISMFAAVTAGSGLAGVMPHQLSAPAERVVGVAILKRIVMPGLLFA